MADDASCFDGVTKATEVPVAPVQGTNEEERGPFVAWRLLLAAVGVACLYTSCIVHLCLIETARV